MRVLHVLPSLSPEWGGPVTVVAGLARAIKAKGVQFTVFAAQGRRVGIGAMPIDGVETQLFPTGSLSRFWTGHAPAMVEALKRAVNDHDIIHIHELWHFPHYAAYGVARQARKPYVVTIHGQMDPWARRQKSLRKTIYMRAIQRRILQQASSLHAITIDEAQQLRDQGLTVPVAVIPNGISAEFFDPPRTRAGFLSRAPGLDGKRMILFLGRIHSKKGLDILAEAFGNVARLRDDVRLVIAGPDEGGYRSQVEAMLRSASALDKAVFTGMLTGNDKLAAFSAADIFVLPSHSEVLGVATLEAMACGLPVVISHQCQFPEVADAGAGLIIDTDSKQLASSLIRLLDSPEERREMGRQGRQLVQERYTWERVADQMSQLYVDVLGAVSANTCHSH